MAEILLGQVSIQGTATVQAKARRLFSTAVTIASSAAVDVAKVTEIISGKASVNSSTTIILREFKTIKYVKAQIVSSSSVAAKATVLKTTKAGIAGSAKMTAYQSERDTRQVMKDYLPRYYDEIREVMAMISTEANEITRLRAETANVYDQFFVNSSDVALDRWERVLGITNVEGRSQESRRQYINAKLRGSGTTTLGSLESVVDSFYRAELTENNSENKLGIKFVGKRGEPENINDIRVAVNDVIPAHIEPDYQFTYLPWSEVEQAKLTWAQAEKYTAHELERTFLIGEEG